MLKPAIRKLFRGIGLDIVRHRPQDDVLPADFGDEDANIIREVRPWTMTSAERIYSLIQAVRYLCSNDTKGAIVECGVWKGGSMAAAAKTLLKMQDSGRDLYLFDTFEGMSEPTSKDVDYSGRKASDVLSGDSGFRCANAPLEGVKKVLYDTGYPKEKIHFVQGKVEETIPAAAPDLISLLRLDTDWYESTKHELVHLFPRLSPRGIIIIDDYGHWRGSREACDEYFDENHIHILLNRIDYTGRIGIKI
jgi:O-methyltransferase